MMKKEYLILLEEYICQFKKVYIFGAGRYGGVYHEELLTRNIDIEAFVVSNPSENFREYRGKPVIGIHNLKTDPKECVFVLGTNENYHHEIFMELNRGGYNNIAPFGKNEWFLTEIERKRRSEVSIEITTRIGCSVNCRYCPQALLVQRYFANDSQRKAVLSLEDYRKVLGHLPSNAIITFSGFVEPFLNPECADMIVATAEHGNRLSLHTSLVGMHLTDFEKIRDVPFEYIVLHLPDKKGYANIPVTKEYLDVLDRVLEARKPDGVHWELSANSQSDPVPEIIERIAGRLYYTKIHLIDRAGNLKDEDVNEKVNIGGSIYCPKSPELRRNVLLPDGDLVLCCMDFGLEHRLGNLIDESYDEIRESKEILMIQKALLTEGSHLICRHCSIAKKVGT